MSVDSDQLRTRRLRRLEVLMDVVYALLFVTMLQYPSKGGERYYPGLLIALGSNLSGITVVVMVVHMIIAHALRSRVGRGATIAGSLCAYLLLGLLWSFLYQLADLAEPGSFVIRRSSLGRDDP